jgi:hypothetical protein
VIPIPGCLLGLKVEYEGFELGWIAGLFFGLRKGLVDEAELTELYHLGTMPHTLGVRQGFEVDLSLNFSGVSCPEKLCRLWPV